MVFFRRLYVIVSIIGKCLLLVFVVGGISYGLTKNMSGEEPLSWLLYLIPLVVAFFGYLALFFRGRQNEVKQELVQGIVAAGLIYGNHLSGKNEPKHLCTHAGMEVVHFLLHLLDVKAFTILGTSKRNEVFDWVSIRVIHDYVNAILGKDSPDELVEALEKKMIDGVNNRQTIYSQCDSFMGEKDGFPGVGTKVFAFSFFVHRELEKTSREDVDDILAGIRTLEDEDLDDFPDFQDTLENCATIIELMKSIPFDSFLKKLK